MEHIFQTIYYNYGLTNRTAYGWIFTIYYLETDRLGYECFYHWGKVHIKAKTFKKAEAMLKGRILEINYENELDDE